MLSRVQRCSIGETGSTSIETHLLTPHWSGLTEQASGPLLGAPHKLDPHPNCYLVHKFIGLNSLKTEVEASKKNDWLKLLHIFLL